MANMVERVAKFARIKHDEKLIAIEKIRCKRDILYWFDWYAMTYDPRTGPNNKPIGVVPFELYEFQRPVVLQIYNSILSGKDLLVEKSRDMGVSWISICVIEYCWLFIPDFSGRLGSRNVNEVDKTGDISTLFEKVRLVFRYLPKFMRPMGFSEPRHMTYLKMVNPENRATIVGETANASFGRSGRNTVALFDEFAFWENADAAWEACGQTTPCRLAVSTPYGGNNRFAKMANRRIEDQPEKITLHWRSHPKHDDIWYAEQQKRYTKSGLAREVDISYTMSLEGKVIDMFDYGLHVKAVQPTRDMIKNPQNLWTPNPEFPIIVSFDFGRVCSALFMQVDEYYCVDVFHEVVLDGSQGRPRGSTEELALAVLSTMDRYNKLHPYRDISTAENAGYNYIFTGDPAGQVKPWQEKKSFSDHDILQKHGLHPLQIDKVLGAKNRLHSGITLLQSLFNTRYNDRERIYIHNPDKTPTLIAALQGEYKYLTDKNGDITETIDEKHPYEDVMDNLRYGCLQFADIMLSNNHKSKHNYVVESDIVFPA